MADIDWGVLDRYVAGDCTDEERAAVLGWLAAAPANASRLAAAQWVALHGRNAATAERREALWAALEARVGDQPRWRTSSFGSTALKIAAAVFLLLGASLAAYVVLRSPAHAPTLAESNVRTITTARGQRFALRLSDSTYVVLGPASTLRVPRTYGAHDRSVELVGQAAFTVVHDERRPFVVRAGSLVATDLGTEFAVRAYPDDRDADVVVAEGVVAVTPAVHPTDRVVLQRGDRAQVIPGRTVTRSRDVPLDDYFGWTGGRLTFRHTPLRDALAPIARWYDVEIRIASPALEKEGLTATFREGEPPSAVLGVIATALDLTVKMTGPRSYTLYPK